MIDQEHLHDRRPEALTVAGGWTLAGIPPLVRRAGPRAAERLVEFFTAPDPQPEYARGDTFLLC